MSPPLRLCYGLLLTLFPTALAVCAQLAEVAKNQSAYSCVGDKYPGAAAPTWQDFMNTGIQTGMGFAMAGAPLERQSDSACCTPIACLQEGTICATSVSKPCPTEQPTANSACGASSEGLVCKYDLNCKENLAGVVTGCYFITQAECTEAAWRVLQESSGPPSEHATCEPGKDFASADGCNTCFCPDSGMKSMAACTEKACPTPASLCSLIRCSNEATDTVGSDCFNCYGGGCVDCSGTPIAPSLGRPFRSHLASPRPPCCRQWLPLSPLTLFTPK